MANDAAKAFALVLPLMLIACHPKVERGPSIAKALADKFVTEAANAPPAPNVKMAKDYKALVGCSASRIRASDIAQGDPPKAIHAKVQAAMRACEKQIYGTPTS